MIRSKGIKWAGHVARMAKKRKSIQGFGVGEPEGKRPLERPNLRRQ